MSTNMVFSDIPSTRRVVVVPSGTGPGAPIIAPGGEAAVTITGRGDYTSTQTLADGTVITINGGGVGLPANSATCAFNGSFAFPVAGASASTTPGTAVYRTTAGALTLTVGTNALYGIVDFFRGELSATDTVVKIGVVVA